jgi:hypothetical protein
VVVSFHLNPVCVSLVPPRHRTLGQKHNRTLALCEISTREALQLPVRMTFDTPSSSSSSSSSSPSPTNGGGGANDHGGLVALLTPIADRRMGGQADTGYVNWPAATILARWLALHPGAVGGRVMEVGAGLGLCGLVAGRWAREVLLTDYNVACLERLQRHVDLNQGKEEEGAPCALSREGGVKVRWLDWERIETLPSPSSNAPPAASGGVEATGAAACAVRWRVVAAEGGGGEGDEDECCGGAADNDEPEPAAYWGSSSGSSMGGSSDSAFGWPAWGAGLLDVIVGSDVICDATCARGVAGLLAATLKPAAEGGVAYVTAPFPAHRYGVDCFPAELKGAWEEGGWGLFDG